MSGWPGEVESITVTWMDGTQETYPCTHFKIADGELRLWKQYKGGFNSDQRYDERGVPLATMRIYNVNRIGQ